MRNIRFAAAIAALALALPLGACGSDLAPAEHGEEGAEAEKGPNGDAS
jgi:cobalt-zinc-cadmium efflux system membrane fusion protein